MKSFIIPILFLPCLMWGQSIEREVIATQGAYETSEDMTVSWTLGETLTSSSRPDITEGFQQPAFEVEVIPTQESSSLVTTAYPNPTSGMLTIETSGLNSTQDITVWDGAGRELLNLKSADPTTRIDMSKYASGQYFIRVTDHTVLESALLSVIKH